jgi:predicted ATPase
MLQNEDEAPQSDLPSSTMPDWPMVGRTEELGVLIDALHDESSHAGVAIVGRPGLGKTRLAQEAAKSAARQGWSVHQIAATVAAQSIPLGAFARWLGQIDSHPLNMAGTVITALTASAPVKPLLITVDDAHLLDDLSAFVLHELVRRRAAAIIMTVRTGKPASETVSSPWKDGYLRRLDLQPLSRPECHALLVTALGGEVGAETSMRIWDLTHGNPLSMHELIRQEREAARLSRDETGWHWNGEMTASPTLVDSLTYTLEPSQSPC